MKRRLIRWGMGAALVLGVVFLVRASSHREAPLISADPLADNTDVYAFVSPDAPTTVTFVANWIPLESPAGGPNFYKFGDDVLYRINIDNNGDAEDDIVYEFRFKTQIQNPNTFLYNTGVITSLTDSTFNVRQTYSVTRIDHQHRVVLGDNLSTPPVNNVRRALDAGSMTRSPPAPSIRCRTARRCSPGSGTIRFLSISDPCSTCSV